MSDRLANIEAKLAVCDKLPRQVPTPYYRVAHEHAPWLVAQLKAARKVVEAARDDQCRAAWDVDKGIPHAQACKWCRAKAVALAEYDKVAG